MAKYQLNRIIFILLIFANVISCSNKQKSQQDEIARLKQEALEKIKTYYAADRLHQDRVREIENLLKHANHNIQLITQIAEYVSTLDYHTELLVDIAKIAAKTDHECKELEKFVELAVLKACCSDEIIELAKQSTRAKTGQEKTKINKEIERLKATAEYKTIEEAR